jgi:hypothetical protein
MLVGVRVLRAEWPKYFIRSSVSAPPHITSYPSNTIMSLAIPMAFVPAAQAVAKEGGAADVDGPPLFMQRGGRPG